MACCKNCGATDAASNTGLCNGCSGVGSSDSFLLRASDAL